MARYAAMVFSDTYRRRAAAALEMPSLSCHALKSTALIRSEVSAEAKARLFVVGLFDLVSGFAFTMAISLTCDVVPSYSRLRIAEQSLAACHAPHINRNALPRPRLGRFDF